MTPYKFNAPDADIILRSSDGKELHVHRLILSLSSPVFQDMFDLPQSTPPSQTPIVDIPDASKVLKPFIQYLYPRPPPNIVNLSMWAGLYAIAEKYNVEAVMEPLRDILISRFLRENPLRVYALASRWGLKKEAKIASRRTLAIDIFEDFPREDAELMGGAACQQLYLLHFNRREAAQALIEDHPRPVSNDPDCTCSSLKCKRLFPALSQRLSTIPWLTAEELCQEIAKAGDYPKKCGKNCRHAIRHVHAYFASLLKAISDLPQTI